jgi:hypothetical protein
MTMTRRTILSLLGAVLALPAAASGSPEIEVVRGAVGQQRGAGQGP